MFFVLSKTFGIVLLPATLFISLGICGIFLLLTPYVSLGRKFVVASVAALAIFGYSPLGTVLLVGLEERFPPWDASRGAPDGIVILGGAINPNLSAARGIPIAGSGIDRVLAAARLARQFPNIRIVFSGGSPNLFPSPAREADYGAQVIDSFGISPDRVLQERRARNTAENAEYSKALAQPKPGERWLLVTSAYHMPRAAGAFRKAGFPVEPYPVDWRTSGRRSVFRFSVHFIAGLATTDVAVREWIGLLAYWLTGRTSELFPGPEPDTS